MEKKAPVPLWSMQHRTSGRGNGSVEKEKERPVSTEIDTAREPFHTFHEERERRRQAEGFQDDEDARLHREETFQGYKESGPVSYRPGFNPPRLRTRFGDIPRELRSEILASLPTRERARVQRVSKEFRGESPSVAQLSEDIIRVQFNTHTYTPVQEERGGEYAYQEWNAAMVAAALNLFFARVDLPLTAAEEGHGGLNVSSKSILQSDVRPSVLKFQVGLPLPIYGMLIHQEYKPHGNEWRPIQTLGVEMLYVHDTRVSALLRESYPPLSIFLERLASLRGYTLEKRRADKVYSKKVAA